MDLTRKALSKTFYKIINYTKLYNYINSVKAITLLTLVVAFLGNRSRRGNRVF